MMPYSGRESQIGWLTTGSLLLALGIAMVGALVVVERQRPAAVRAVELSYLPKGQYLRLAVLGYRQIAADFIWLKAVQHFGEREQTSKGYRWAYHAVDVLTDVDPKFIFAYQAAGTVLGVWGGMAQESIALLTKGMHHNPAVWQLPFTVGYDYFYELCDPVSAAQYFRIASHLPGAPEYLPKLAARMSVEAGDPDAAVEFLQRFSQQVGDQRLRDALTLRMKEVVIEQDIRFLEEGVRRYTSRYGRLPLRLTDLVTTGIIAGVPEEPLGGKYELRVSNGNGIVASSSLHERLRVYRKVSCQKPGK